MVPAPTIKPARFKIPQPIPPSPGVPPDLTADERQREQNRLKDWTHYCHIQDNEQDRCWRDFRAWENSQRRQAKVETPLTSQQRIRKQQQLEQDRIANIPTELMGLTAAIIAVPKEQDIHVQLDNESVVKQFDKIITNRSISSAQDRIRCNNFMDWSVLAAI
ncbi:hypothetical protein BGX33_002938, partial [Mortierella sp. NVP41]